MSPEDRDLRRRAMDGMLASGAPDFEVIMVTRRAAFRPVRKLATIPFKSVIAVTTTRRVPVPDDIIFPIGARHDRKCGPGKAEQDVLEGSQLRYFEMFDDLDRRGRVPSGEAWIRPRDKPFHQLDPIRPTVADRRTKPAPSGFEGI